MNKTLEEKIDAIKCMTIEELCEKFNCLPEEICLGDYIASETDDTVCPYKVILGFANFEGSKVESLGNLEIVYGKKFKERNFEIRDINGNAIYNGINLKNSRITSLGKLSKVYGTCSIGNKITSLGNLKFIGSNLYLNRTKLTTIDSELSIDGRLNVEECVLESFGKLKRVGTIYISSTKLRDVGNIEKLKSLILGKGCSPRVVSLIQKSFDKYQGKFIKREENIHNNFFL